MTEKKNRNENSFELNWTVEMILFLVAEFQNNFMIDILQSLAKLHIDIQFNGEKSSKYKTISDLRIVWGAGCCSSRLMNIIADYSWTSPGMGLGFWIPGSRSTNNPQICGRKCISENIFYQLNVLVILRHQTVKCRSTKVHKKPL